MELWNAKNEAISNLDSYNNIIIWIGQKIKPKWYYKYKEKLDIANTLTCEYNTLYKLLYDPTLMKPIPPAERILGY